MKTTTRKPQGKFKVMLRHRNLRGYIFRAGDIYNYYGTTQANSCGCRRMPIITMYQTLKGLIPKDKIELI